MDIISANNALVAAICHGHHNCINFLLKKGAFENCVDEVGNTPLGLAFEQGNIKIKE